jgi:hypothetical protein
MAPGYWTRSLRGMSAYGEQSPLAVQAVNALLYGLTTIPTPPIVPPPPGPGQVCCIVVLRSKNRIQNLPLDTQFILETPLKPVP